MAAPSPEAMQPPRPKRPKQESKIKHDGDSNSAWTPEQQVEFINFWQSCPELYDFYNEDYNNEEKRLEICAMLGHRLSHKRSAIEVRQKVEFLQACWQNDRELVRRKAGHTEVPGKLQLRADTYHQLMFLENGFPKGQRVEFYCLKHPILTHKDTPCREHLPQDVAGQDVLADTAAFQQFQSKSSQPTRAQVRATVASGTPEAAVDLTRQTPPPCPCQNQPPDIARYLSYIGCELTTLSVARREAIMLRIKGVINETRAYLEHERTVRKNRMAETNTVMSHFNVTDCKPCSLCTTISKENETINESSTPTMPIIPTPIWPNNVYPDLLPHGWYPTPPWMPYYRGLTEHPNPPIMSSLEHSIANLLHDTSRSTTANSYCYPPVAITPIPHVCNEQISTTTPSDTEGFRPPDSAKSTFCSL